MSFLSPLWLLGLLPWAAVVVWVFTGKHERTAVPFLDLWKDRQAPPPQAARVIHAPPLPVLLLLFGTLVAILASARPRLAFLNATESSKLIFVIDRGFSASASPGWTDQVDRVGGEIAARFPGALIERVLVPESEPALIDTQPILAAAIERSLTDPSALIVAFTDQTLAIENPRVIQIVPESRGSNVGIAKASASDQPRTQVMVRIRNDSGNTGATLNVGSVSQTIELPPQGMEKNYFVDLDQLGTTTSTELRTDGDLSADNRINLLRTVLRPRLVPDADLPPELHRIVESYAKLRPPGTDSRSIPITARKDLGTAIPLVILASTDHRLSNTISVDAHPITSSIDWPTVAQAPLRVAPAPGSEWRILAKAGSEPIVAIREAPVRQVWVGFQSDAFPRTTDFVVFWTNVFDWLGGGGEHFKATGTFALPIRTPPPIDWRSKLADIPPALQPGREVTSILALLALLMIFAAALFGGLQKLRGGLGSRES